MARQSRHGPRAQRIDDALSALADPTRRRVVDLLRERPRRAGDLAARFDVSAPAMSRHLRVLRTKGIIEESRLDEDARVRVYRLRRKPFEDLQSWLGEVESLWTRRLDALEAHAEGAGERKPRAGRSGARSAAR